MKLSDKMYDFVKYLCAIILPACATAIAALGALFGWEWADIVVKVIAIAETFIGAVFCISNANYYKENSDDNE